MAKTATKTKAPLTETEKAEREAKKRARFLDVGGKRVAKALKAIALLKNVANRASYSYTETDVTKMRDALSAAVKDALAPFAVQSAGKPEAETFKFE